MTSILIIALLFLSVYLVFPQYLAVSIMVFVVAPFMSYIISFCVTLGHDRAKKYASMEETKEQ